MGRTPERFEAWWLFSATPTAPIHHRCLDRNKGTTTVEGSRGEIHVLLMRRFWNFFSRSWVAKRIEHPWYYMIYVWYLLLYLAALRGLWHVELVPTVLQERPEDTAGWCGGWKTSSDKTDVRRQVVTHRAAAAPVQAAPAAAAAECIPTRWQVCYGAVLPRRRPHHVLILSVCLSVCPVPPPRGKTKRPTNTKLGRKGPRDTSTPWTNFKVRGQRSRSRRLIALLAKNPHNLAACCPINLIFGRWRKDPLPPFLCLESPKTARTYSTARTAP